MNRRSKRKVIPKRKTVPKQNFLEEYPLSPPNNNENMIRCPKCGQLVAKNKLTLHQPNNCL